MKHVGAKFTAMLVFFYAIFAVGPGFYVVAMGMKGVQPQNIGIFTAMIALTATVTQPIYGFLCDKTCKARQILLGAMTISVLGYVGLILLDGTLSTVLCSLLIGGTLNAMYGFSESWLSKLGCERHGVNFGAVRSFGSLSYAVTAALYGFVFDRFGVFSMPVCMAACLICMAVVAMRCPNPTQEEPVCGDVLAGEMAAVQVKFADAFRVLLKNKRYMLVVVCYTLASLPTGAALTYYPMHLKDLGGTAASVGLSMFFLAGSEFFIMQAYKKLEAKFGNMALLGFAFFMFGIKNIVIALAPNVTVAVLAAMTQAFCYGLVVPATQSFVEKNITQEYAATAQLVCNTGGMMLSQLPGALLGGFLVQYISVGNMLLCTSLFAFVAFVLYVIGLRRLTKNNANPV